MLVGQAGSRLTQNGTQPTTAYDLLEQGTILRSRRSASDDQQSFQSFESLWPLSHYRIMRLPLRLNLVPTLFLCINIGHRKRHSTSSLLALIAQSSGGSVIVATLLILVLTTTFRNALIVFIVLIVVVLVQWCSLCSSVMVQWYVPLFYSPLLRFDGYCSHQIILNYSFLFLGIGQNGSLIAAQFLFSHSDAIC